MNPRPLKLPSYELKYLTWKDVEKYLSSNDRIIVPIGSTEQHGPKSILGTDHLAAEHIAIELAKQSKVLVTPTLSIGMSEHHLAFPGTMSFSKEVYYLVVYNLLAKLAKHGFKRILLINGHGGNCRTVKAVFHQLSQETKDLSFALVNWWDIPSVKEYLDMNFGKWEGKHATPGETSLMMYFHPEMISTKPVPKGKRPSKEKYTGCSKPEDYRKLFPEGIWYADPNLASQKHGKAIFNLSIEYLLPKINKWFF
jgi:creatinine amidohydrolase